MTQQLSKEVKDKASSLDADALLSLISKDELVKLAVKLNKYLEDEHKLSAEELRSEAIAVPVSIFSKDLSPLESLVKFLKEEQHMTFHKIGVSIGRDERGIWVTYRNACSKMAGPFTLPEHDTFVPLNIFTDGLSILEALVKYLKEERKIKVAEIASLVKKSTSTIWTVYHRAKKKQ